jgi:DNA-binding NarL/FixJ family response regulator
VHEDRITILLVDDHTMMREGTRRLLEEDPALEVVGEAQDGEEAIACWRRTSAAVVILDISMKGMSGFGVARALLAQPNPPALLVLTAYDQFAYAQAMLRLGVKGYWLKSARGSEIRQAVHDVAAGRTSMGPEVRQMLAEGEEEQPVAMEPLTSRETAVLLLVAQGERNTEIARRLSISVKTVETHLTSLYGKLHVQSRAEAIALALKQGLLLEKDE